MAMYTSIYHPRFQFLRCYSFHILKNALNRNHKCYLIDTALCYFNVFRKDFRYAFFRF